jgi:hypothetical protein
VSLALEHFPEKRMPASGRKRDQPKNLPGLDPIKTEKH